MTRHVGDLYKIISEQPLGANEAGDMSYKVGKIIKFEGCYLDHEDQGYFSDPEDSGWGCYRYTLRKHAFVFYFSDVEPISNNRSNCSCKPISLGCRCGIFAKEMESKGRMYNAVTKEWD